MKWNFEISKRCKKASQRLYVIRKLHRFMNKNELIQIHNNIVLSILEYRGPIFFGMSSRNSSAMEKVQRRSHKIICGSSCDCHSFPLLSDRRKTHALKCFLAMRDDDHILHPLFPRYLPSSKRLAFPFCRSSRRLSSFIPSCILLYNS